MGVFCIVLGSVISAGMVVFGAWLGNLFVTTPYFLNATMKLYQGLGLPNVLMTYIVAIAAGILLALMLGLPMIVSGMALRKSNAALNKATALNKKLKKMLGQE